MKKQPYPKPPHLPNDFITCVPWSQIEARLGKREYARFSKWMAGQTCLKEGAYLWDVQHYIEQRNRGINAKHAHTYD